ncbi:MAG: RsmE family RNA methyltransferase [Bryobacteraceae bacterium]
MVRRRFFVGMFANGKAELHGDDARHAVDVLRVQVSQRFELSDNNSVYLAEVVSTRKDRVQFSLLEELALRPEPVRLWLYVSLVKFDRLEWIIEKGTELGVERFVPVDAARSEKGLADGARNRMDRWRRVARSASQQSRRDRMPEILPPAGLGDALRAEAAHRYFLDEAEGVPVLLDLIPAVRHAGDTVALLTGPEGGWTDAERGDAVAWTTASLGPRILRAETAVLAALAVVSMAWATVSASADHAQPH